MKPCAKWTPDCQGKQDYDGHLIRISTRYWPRGGGFGMVTRREGGRIEIVTNADRSIPASAHSSILLEYGEPDQYGYGDSVTISERLFEAETETEVKAAVEAWVQSEFDRIVALLSVPAPPAAKGEPTK